jgi:hypothetical protein
MRSYFTPKPKTLHPLPLTAELHGVQLEVAVSESGELNENDIFTGYLSDDESSGSDEDDNDDELMQTNSTSGSSGCTADRINRYSRLDVGDLNADEASFWVRVPPQPKRRKLDVPARVACQQAQEDRKNGLELALKDMEKLIRSKHEIFEAGRNGLQEYRA